MEAWRRTENHWVGEGSGRPEGRRDPRLLRGFDPPATDLPLVGGREGGFVGAGRLLVALFERCSPNEGLGNPAP